MLFDTLLHELPAAQRLTNANASVQEVLRRIETDVREASALRIERAADPPYGFSCMSEEGQITWTWEQGRLTRRDDDGELRTSAGPQQWPLPDAELRFEPLGDPDGAADALVVHTAVLHRRRGVTRRKLTNTQVFFLGKGVGR